MALSVGTIVKIQSAEWLRDNNERPPSVSSPMLSLANRYAIIASERNENSWYKITADRGNNIWAAEFFSETFKPFQIGDSVEISTVADQRGANPGMMIFAGKRYKITRTDGINQFRMDNDSDLIWQIDHFNMDTLVRAGKDLPRALKRKQYQILNGWELEVNDIPSIYNDNTDKKYHDFKEDFRSHGISAHTDASVTGRGLEFILNNPKPCADSLKELIWFMKKYPPQVNKSCGLHFHYSIHELTESGELLPLRVLEKSRFVNNLFALCSLYEDQLFQLFPESRQHNSYCCRFREKYSTGNSNVREKLGYISESKSSNNKRYCWLNVVEMYREGGHGTVEFRILGDTVNIPYIVNVAIMFQYLVKQSLLLNIQRNPDALNIINKTLFGTYSKEINSTKNARDTSEHGDDYLNSVISEIEKLQTFTGGRSRGGV